MSDAELVETLRERLHALFNLVTEWREAKDNPQVSDREENDRLKAVRAQAGRFFDGLDVTNLIALAARFEVEHPLGWGGGFRREIDSISLGDWENCTRIYHERRKLLADLYRLIPPPSNVTGTPVPGAGQLFDGVPTPLEVAITSEGARVEPAGVEREPSAKEEDARGQEARTGPKAEVGRSVAKRGRKPYTDFAADRRLYEAWQSKNYAKYSELAKEKGQRPDEVRRAIDRHRKRIGAPK